MNAQSNNPRANIEKRLIYQNIMQGKPVDMARIRQQTSDILNGKEIRYKQNGKRVKYNLNSVRQYRKQLSKPLSVDELNSMKQAEAARVFNQNVEALNRASLAKPKHSGKHSEAKKIIDLSEYLNHVKEMNEKKYNRQPPKRIKKWDEMQAKQLKNDIFALRKKRQDGDDNDFDRMAMK